MITRRHLLRGSAATLIVPLVCMGASAQEPAHATILFDAFGAPSNLKRGWGYSVFVEHGSRRILFDTGGKSAAFAENVSALGVDLKRLDFVVLTHRHNDHTASINHVLRQNPAADCTYQGAVRIRRRPLRLRLSPGARVDGGIRSRREASKPESPQTAISGLGRYPGTTGRRHFYSALVEAPQVFAPSCHKIGRRIAASVLRLA
jgi:hypothetical protein